MTLIVDFEPAGRRVACERGGTLLEATQRAGIALNAICGGDGSCGRCVVRLMDGRLSAPSLTEEAELGSRLADGWRLACEAELLEDARVYIPPESLATAQRTQTEGRAVPITLDPGVHAMIVTLPPPSLDDLRSDAARLRDAWGRPDLVIPAAVLRTLSDDLRANEFRVSAYVRGSSLVGVRPAGTPALGLAVDLGTTKLAAYLVDLGSGETLGAAGAMNPQIAFGEDVMARIHHAMSRAGGEEQLRLIVVDALQDLAARLCAESGRSTADIAEAVVVGNTVMHHLFLGLPVRQLGLAPYVPAETAPLDLPAGEVGFNFARGANVHMLPNIAGFVGADHVAMLVGSGLLEQQGVVLGMDIGTNTEISLVAKGKHYASSTASGPAFEGAHIRHGMRAAPGAIERVFFRDGKIDLQTIEDQPPIGLCGSGILDLVAQLRGAGLLDRRGSFAPAGQDARVRPGKSGAEFVVVPAGEAGGNEITFSRSDVNEIQLAKGAMRTGISILLKRAGIDENQIDTVIIAGAFGSYLDVQSGIDIGMFPRLPKERFVQVGNAAGTGARMALLSMAQRERAIEIARQVSYVELTAERDFSKLFAKALLLE